LNGFVIQSHFDSKGMGYTLASLNSVVLIPSLCLKQERASTSQLLSLMTDYIQGMTPETD